MLTAVKTLADLIIGLVLALLVLTILYGVTGRLPVSVDLLAALIVVIGVTVLRARHRQHGS